MDVRLAEPKKSQKAIARYDYENGKIDFERLQKDIEERQGSAYRLYHYIYRSKELARIVKAMGYKRSSLRNHLLLMVNLAINYFINGNLVINNKEEVALSIEKNKHRRGKALRDKPAKDAEKQPLSFMSKKTQESATNSRNGKKKDIEREEPIRKFERVEKVE